MGTTMTGTGETVTLATNDSNLEKLKDKLEEEIKAKKDLEKLAKQIEITITPEGLRIELLEGRNATFFESGSARLSGMRTGTAGPVGRRVKDPAQFTAHRRSHRRRQISNGANYGNWELSADRANSARRLLQQNGVRSDQVTQVRGYADQLLRVKNNPYDPSNRRISLLVKNDNGVAPNIPQNKLIAGSKPVGTPFPPPVPSAGHEKAKTRRGSGQAFRPGKRPSQTGDTAGCQTQPHRQVQGHDSWLPKAVARGRSPTFPLAPMQKRGDLPFGRPPRFCLYTDSTPK